MPISKTLDRTQAVGKGLVELACAFTFTAAGDTLSVTPATSGFTVASLTDTAVGQFTLVLPGGGAVTMVHASLMLEEPTQNLQIYQRSYTAATRTLVFHIRTAGTDTAGTGGTPVDADPTSGAILRCRILVKNSSV